jgi:iron complex transport system ATP-binding protein
MRGGALTLTNIDVRRFGRAILSIDELAISRGTFVGIIGPNGAGKTTLLKVCAALVAPDRGRVILDDSDLTRLGSWRRCRLRRRIGHIPQSVEYNAELPFTVREVAVMGRTAVRPLLRSLNRSDVEAVDHWLAALGLADRRHQTFRSLSGGEQQKVLIARAMAQDPEILMLDEPCANLDFNWKYQISELVERLYRQTSMTVMMVSHDASVLPAACGRIVLMEAGRVLEDGPTEQVLTPEILSRAYQADFGTIISGNRRYVVPVPPAHPKEPA